MQKVIAILEKHVQWIALGLAVLFFGYMVYGYVLSPPVAATVGGKELGPGDVDPYILENPTRKLEEAMNNNQVIEMPVTPFAEQFAAAMSWSSQPIPTLAGEQFVQLPTFPATSAPEAPVPNAPGPGKPRTPLVPDAFVVALPEIPAPELLETRVGRSTVLDQLPPGQAAPAAQPGVPVDGGSDKAWVTQKFKIDMTALSNAFDVAKIPQPFMPTFFVQIEMVRQEMDGNGNWDPKSETVVPVLVNLQTLIPPFPTQGDKVGEGNLLKWAPENTQMIVAPPFYAIAGGDPWVQPGIEAAAVVALPFDAATTTKRPDQMTPEEKEAWLKHNREEAARKREEQKNRPKQTPRPAPGRGGGGPADIPGASFAPREGGNATPPPAPRPPARPPARQQVNLDLPPEMRGDGVGPVGDPAAIGAGPGAVAMPQPGVAFPAGQFVPKEWSGKETEGWVHDDTVVAGRTYRYKLRYKLKNPIFQALNVAKPPGLADPLTIDSKFSEWGASVVVPNVINFYIANNPIQGRSSVKIDVFRWEAGVQKKETFSVDPGDSIGAPKNGIDFTTGCTVVDVRANARTGAAEIIVMDADGKTTLRTYNKDQNDPMYNQLKSQAATSVVPPPGAVGAAGVGPGNVYPR